MKTVILAGGLGTRLSEETVVKPKPMVEVGGHPILWHIMNIYSHFGHRDFLIALGYKGEMIKDYFLKIQALSSDLTLDLATGETKVHGGDRLPWRVTLVDTGQTTQTGGRVKRMGPWLDAGETFLLTYGDGVGNVDLQRLVAFHKRHGKLATVTAVRPPARFGSLEMEGDRVVRFAEKPQVGEGWINGGFFVLEKGALDYISGDDILLEQAPLEGLSRDGQLMAYRHEGFWQPMDTLREKYYLEDLWTSGKAPWKVWP